MEVLEQIKHFFSVPGIVFVLSIDKTHLESSVKGFYGSEQINSAEYLRRFIDLEYSIPKPAVKEFVDYLFDYYGFKDFFLSIERTRYNELRNDADFFLRMAEFLITKSNSTLRQTERIFSLAKLVIDSFKIDEYTFPQLLFVLVYLKILRNDFYTKINNSEFTLQDLSNSFGDLVLTDRNVHDRINLAYIEATLLWFYNNNNPDYRTRANLLGRDESGKATTTIKSKLIDGNGGLVSYFSSLDGQRYNQLSLDFLLKKINLTESVVIR